MSSSKVPDQHLAIVTDKRTGLYHGAVYRNAPTPSGSPRYLLALTMDQGHLSARDAVLAVNAAFPAIEPLDVDAAPADAAPADALPPDGFTIPRGAVLTRVTPRTAEAKEEAKGPNHMPVEVTHARKLLDIRISPAQLDRMIELGHVRDESTSGNNPELHYRYDHYVMTEVGRRFHPFPPGDKSRAPKSRAA